MDARRYLHELMVSLVDSFDATGQPELGAIRSQLQGAARALVATGDLPPEAVHEVLAAFEDHLEERGMAQRVQRSMSASSTVSIARDPDAPEPRPSPPRRPRGPARLERVLPINETVGAVDDFTVTAISLELWSTHLSFRYALHGGDMRQLLGARGMPNLGWEAYDDRGGVYPISGSSAGGGGTGGLVGHVTFVGPLAEAAQQFVVRLRYRDQGPMSVLIDLPDREG